MLKDIFNKIKLIDDDLLALGKLDIEAFKEEINQMLDALPQFDILQELRKTAVELTNAKRQAKENIVKLALPGHQSPKPVSDHDIVAKLEAKYTDMLSELQKHEGVRVTKKVADFMIERAMDHIKPKDQDDLNKLKLLDQMLMEIQTTYSGTITPSVDSVIGVDVKFVKGNRVILERRSAGIVQ